MLWICLLGLWACNTREEGCLDPTAANFDLSAEKACTDCCDFPSLSISMTQKWDDRNFSINDTLYDKNGLSYMIHDLKFFLTSWSWSGTDDIMHTVDSASIACEMDSVRYTPDILTIDARQFVYTLGTIHKAPDIDTIRLLMGLDPDLDCVDPFDTLIPGQLSANSSLWDNTTSQLATIRIIYRPDLMITDTDTLFVHVRQSLTIPYTFGFERGADTQWKLTVNYRLWFDEVDKLVPESFKQSLLNGLEGSLFATP